MSGGKQAIGAIDIAPIVDGEICRPFELIYPMDDLSPLTPEVRAQYGPTWDHLDGSVVLTMGGYLVRTGDRIVLFDVGIGQWPKTPPMAGGSLRSHLLAEGVHPEDVTDVVYTHLHFDHIGWSTRGGEVFFPNAEYHCDARDWEYFLSESYDAAWEAEYTNPETDDARVRLAPIRERIRFWEVGAELLPGVTVLDASGHTPGSCVFRLDSDGERGYLLGDIVHTIPELTHVLRHRSHVDPKRAVARVREFRDLVAAEGALCSGSHFPGLTWGRLELDANSGSCRWHYV